MIRCRACSLPGASGRQTELTPGALAAARYLLRCDLKKLFSFTLGEEDLRRLGNFSESYLLTKLERSFRTLDFYKSVGEAE